MRRAKMASLCASVPCTPEPKATASQAIIVAAVIRFPKAMKQSSFVVWFAFPPSRPPCENPAERSQKQETPGDFHRAKCQSRSFVGFVRSTRRECRRSRDSNAKVCWWQKKRKGCSSRQVREKNHAADPRCKNRHVLWCRRE